MTRCFNPSVLISTVVVLKNSKTRRLGSNGVVSLALAQRRLIEAGETFTTMILNHQKKGDEPRPENVSCRVERFTSCQTRIFFVQQIGRASCGSTDRWTDRSIDRLNPLDKDTLNPIQFYLVVGALAGGASLNKRFYSENSV